MSSRSQSLRRELDTCAGERDALARERDQLQAAAREICAWVLGAPPSGPLLDDLQKIPEELGARMALAAYHGASSGHPELDLGSLVDESSSGQASANALVLAGKLEPITAKIAQGLPYVAVRDVRRAEQELDHCGKSLVCRVPRSLPCAFCRAHAKRYFAVYHDESSWQKKAHGKIHALPCVGTRQRFCRVYFFCTRQTQ
jgi:hypothetical protein